MMDILLGFAPFIAFFLADQLIGSTPGLVAGAVVAAILLTRDWMISRQVPKVLAIGTIILFGGLALYKVIVSPAWSVAGVRLRVDAGLLCIVLISIAIRRPFTLQYARERIERERWGSPLFIRTNYTISAVWALAFMVIVVGDLCVLYLPSVPRWAVIAATVLATIGAIKFSTWYPKHVRKR